MKKNQLDNEWITPDIIDEASYCPHFVPAALRALTNYNHGLSNPRPIRVHADDWPWGTCNTTYSQPLITDFDGYLLLCIKIQWPPIATLVVNFHWLFEALTLDSEPEEMDFLTISLSPSQTCWTVAGVAVVSHLLYWDLIHLSDDLSLQLVHLVFKKTETRQPFSLFVLLLAIPAYLTLLYLPHAGSTVLAAVRVFSLFWFTLVTSILVYRVSPWHPLAKYPGPLLCKLTKFHLAFFAFGGKQYLYYYELHQKYGHVVRIGK